MKSKVFFTNFRSRSQGENKVNKVKNIFKTCGFANFIQEDHLTAIKLHFGEKGNDAFIKPVLVRPVVEKIIECGAKPFLTDTNTLYYGSRHDSVEHLKTAIIHGFDYAVVGSPVIIADGLLGNNWIPVKVSLKHFHEVKIASDIEISDSMVVLSHFKGHGMSGFGGAIKNLAMGCAAAPGKIEQHQCAKPVITEECSGCGTCVESCPVSAMFIRDKMAFKDEVTCIGCNNCLAICPDSSIRLDQEALGPFMERMVEYAYGAVKNKQGKVGYINFLMDITPDCDCEAFSDTSIVPDIGILASNDPVAIDSVSYDLVNQQTGLEGTILEHHHQKGKDKFQGVWEGVEGRIQLSYAEEIGLGSTQYELIRV
jgi:uncharacterized Fe-S center protein